VKRLSLPQAPEAYEVKLPSDFKPPDGITFEFKKDDPLLAQARTMAHAMGISQDNFSKLLGLYAGAQVASQQAITTARNAEIAKLGATGTARVTAINTWLEAMGVPGLQARVLTASDVQAYESLITKFSGQGSGSFSQRGREVPEPEGKLPPGAEGDKIWDSWGYNQKKEYSEKFGAPRANGAAA
jgi:hypothetical protein